MDKKSSEYHWIPLWVDKWIFGSTRIELQPDERAVWVDFMALAAKDNGWVRANPQTPYPPDQLAGLLCISKELLERSIKKFLETGKIKVIENCAGYYITNWQEFSLSKDYQRRISKKGLHYWKKGKDKNSENSGINSENSGMSSQKTGIHSPKHGTILIEDRRYKIEDIKNNMQHFFDKFWSIYPSRNGKKTTKKESFEFFKKNFKSEEEINLLLIATANYAKSKRAREGYVKDPIRFLKKDFWRDWIEPEKEEIEINPYLKGLQSWAEEITEKEVNDEARGRKEIPFIDVKTGDSIQGEDNE